MLRMPRGEGEREEERRCEKKKKSISILFFSSLLGSKNVDNHNTRFATLVRHYYCYPRKGFRRSRLERRAMSDVEEIPRKSRGTHSVCPATGKEQ